MTEYQKASKTFTNQLGDLYLVNTLINNGVKIDTYTSDEQKQIASTKVLKPRKLKSKLIEGEEPTDGQIKMSIREFNNLCELLVSHPLEAGGRAFQLPIDRYGIKDVISAKIREITTTSQKNPKIKAGQRIMTVVVNRGKKKHYDVKWWVFI